MSLSHLLFVGLVLTCNTFTTTTNAWVVVNNNGGVRSSSTTITTKSTTPLFSTTAPIEVSKGPPEGGYTLDGEKIRGPITPLGNYILVQTKETLTSTEGGILLPDQSTERSTEGLVLAAGPGKIHPFTGIRIPNSITEGDSVFYGRFVGQPIMYNEEQCQMIRDDDVLLYYKGNKLTVDNAMPYRDNILVYIDLDEKLQTSSGIVIAQQVVADDTPCEGTVIKVGEGRYNSSGELSKCPYKVGDKVKFKDYAGNDVTIDGKIYVVVKMVDTLCTLDSSNDNDDEDGSDEDKEE